MAMDTATISLQNPVPKIRKLYSQIPEALPLPNLIQVQLQSFEWFQKEGLKELFDEISPITDFTGSRMELRFLDYEFREPKHTEAECRARDTTYAAPLFVLVRLSIKETGEHIEQHIYMGDFPLMTSDGTFVVNGAERVVVSQLVRSPGIYFTKEDDPASGRGLAFAKLIPNRGAWLEFETSNRDVLSVKVDRRRKIPVTVLLRSIGIGSDEELLSLFADVDGQDGHNFIRSTIDREPTKTTDEALIEFYRRLRPGDPPNLDNAQSLVNALFFNPRRYDLGRVGRYKVNKRLEGSIPQTTRILTREDITSILRHIIQLNNGNGSPDDIDHLGNRRVRAVGELIQNQVRIGLLRMERVIRERMTITNPEEVTPSALINIRPVVAAVKEFFGGSQLSQFMDQTNPLAELTHKRRLSALGPGGLSRDRAGFEVRDVHHSHYGRICPIETPEGPNIGLIGSLATYGRVNEYGFIETPYRKVLHEISSHDKDIVGRTVRDTVKDPNGKDITKAGTAVSNPAFNKLKELPEQKVHVTAYASDNIDYLSADVEDRYIVAQANVHLDERNQFIDNRVEGRHSSAFVIESPEHIDYMDVAPKQIVSVATSLIPFLEHDDANRALMGSNMQRQAVPLVRPEVPLVGTGMEQRAAWDSGHVVFAKSDGKVVSVTGNNITVESAAGERFEHPLIKFRRSNQGTCLTQRPIVAKGDTVKLGQPMADSSSTDQGELALGQSLLCAFMSFDGFNYEDAIILSERVAQDDKFTSVHIEKHEIEARETKLGPEEITRDIPNVGEESLRDLDEEGIVRIGAEVGPGDILVGKITPKGETELTPEEKLLRAIFGEKAREVKDTSLRVPHGEHGKVIGVSVLTREEHPELPPGVIRLVQVSIAQRRKISEGDKMAGRHGNKGVISKIMPVEDMPYMADGTPVEIILNPLGVPSRMNIGQVLEAHLGWAAQTLGFRVVTPVFDGAHGVEIEDALGRAWMVAEALANRSEDYGAMLGAAERVELAKQWVAGQGYPSDKVFGVGATEREEGYAKEVCLKIWLSQQGIDASSFDAAKLKEESDRLLNEQRIAPPTTGKVRLFDGRTGEAFDQPVTIGQMYMLKLVHLVEDKIHARSTGPYSLITQQPLGGKAQFGGQRFGEMEVWALEAYGAAHVLQELLTVKSDDVIGRVKTYEAIVKGEDITEAGVPESFKVLVKELQSLGLAVEVLNEEEESVAFGEDAALDVPDLGIDLTGLEKGEF